MTFVYRILVQLDMDTGNKLIELSKKYNMSRNGVVAKAINQLYDTTIAEKKGEGK